MLQYDIAIQYTRGTRYVGGYIGSDNMEEGWIGIILSKEGIVQRAPVAMFHYVVGMLPLAEKLREGHGDIASPFYTDNLNLAGRAQKVA